MSTPPREPSEEELRAAYEAELKRITTTDVILQTAVSLINLSGRRLGRVPGAEDERDLDQVRDAIDAVRGLLPVLDRHAGPELAPLRDALSQLQMAYAREVQGEPATAGDGPPAAAEPAGDAAGEAAAGTAGGRPPEPDPGDQGPGPAQSSGRLWVPGQ